MGTISISRQLAVFAVWILSLRVALADDLYQEYCSPENTGAQYPRFYWQWQSNGKCYTHCTGYAFAIVQGYYCWCSNYVPAEQVSVSQCNLGCYGYPAESCGSLTNRVFGYVAVGNKPSGTAGGSGVVQTTGGSSQPTSKPVITSRTAASSSAAPRSSSAESPPRPPMKLSTTSNPDTSSIPTSVSASVSVKRVTVSGAVRTQYVTEPPISASSSNTIPVQTGKSGGLSNGAVAGLTIGVIAAVAIIGGLLFYFCFLLPRRRSREEEDMMPASSRTTSNKSPQRSSSFLNGVLGTGKPSMVKPLPRIHTGGFAGMEDENSHNISPMSQRRNSQPLFIDSRLNPNTLMSNSNHSHTSVSTLQDDQDYSRPVLSVRNPDQH